MKQSQFVVCTLSSLQPAPSAMDKLSEQDKVILDTIFDPLQPLGISSDPSKILSQVVNAKDDSDLSEEVKELIKQAIILSDNGHFDEALEILATALERCPRSASVLNDRAQVLRLSGRNEEALEDLNLAVKYSEGQGRAGVQALCQRAALYRFLGRDEEAKEDFAKAAEGGSKFAKVQLAAMNPYAAMCNAMLQKMSVNVAQN